jgi:cell division protein FtsQ
MTDVSPISRDQLRARRKTLRNQRRVHVGQWLWRLLAMSGLTTAIFWGATRPVWLIQDPSQINVNGNDLLTDDLLQSLIPLDYPQPLLKVEPETVGRTTPPAGSDCRSQSQSATVASPIKCPCAGAPARGGGAAR